VTERPLHRLLRGGQEELIPAGKAVSTHLRNWRAVEPETARREAIDIAEQCLERVHRLRGDMRRILLGVVAGILSNGGASVEDLGRTQEQFNALAQDSSEEEFSV
jgi:hypothetical protein